MLSVRMVRVRFSLVLLFAAIIAVSPAFHNHSLIPAAGPDVSHATSVCAACVAGSARIVSPAPAVAEPVIVTAAIAPARVVTVSADARGPVPSRAPPIA